MTRVNLYCAICWATAKRALVEGIGSVGVRGTHESACEPASCPKGHGLMLRMDGVVQESHDGIPVVVGRAGDGIDRSEYLNEGPNGSVRPAQDYSSNSRLRTSIWDVLQSKYKR